MVNYYRAALQYPSKLRHDPQVIMPTLLIWGTNDGALDNKLVDDHDKFVKNFTLEKVEGASHWVQQDEPEKVNQLMKDFLGGQ